MKIADWFKGFENGLAQLSEEERARLFFECGKHCVEDGVFQVYEQLYEAAQSNLRGGKECMMKIEVAD